MGNVPRTCFRPAKFDVSPCMDCEDRVVGCHSSCERYKEYRESNMADYQARKEAYMKENDIEKYSMSVKLRKIKNCRRKW